MNKLVPIDPEYGAPLERAADDAARQFDPRQVFLDHMARQADNTLRRYRVDLRWLSLFMADAGYIDTPQVEGTAALLFSEPDAWSGFKSELLTAFRDWMVWQTELSMGTVNNRLYTVRLFCKLATKAKVLPADEFAQIQLVGGYDDTEAKRIDQRRSGTRTGSKKAAPVLISDDQAAAMMTQPNTLKGTRDAAIMALLLEHGLRVSEVAGLKVQDVNLHARKIVFYRQKVDRFQTHELTEQSYRALMAWYQGGMMNTKTPWPLFCSVTQRGGMKGAGLTERGIRHIVKRIGKTVGLDGLSPHDCRHYWATYWADKVDPFQLQQAGGWSSMTTVRKYVGLTEIANKGMDRNGHQASDHNR